MKRKEWMTEELIECVKEALDKLSDADIAIENIVDTIRYEVEATDEETENEVDAINDELSWDISGSIGELMCRLEELFGVTL